MADIGGLRNLSVKVSDTEKRPDTRQCNHSRIFCCDVGTGDGIAVRMIEHYGRKMYQIKVEELLARQLSSCSIRTAPLWGVRFRHRLMHDGESTTLRDAILRHSGEAVEVSHRFQRLSRSDHDAILDLLNSL